MEYEPTHFLYNKLKIKMLVIWMSIYTFFNSFTSNCTRILSFSHLIASHFTIYSFAFYIPFKCLSFHYQNLSYSFVFYISFDSPSFHCQVTHFFYVVVLLLEWGVEGWKWKKNKLKKNFNNKLAATQIYFSPSIQAKTLLL